MRLEHVLLASCVPTFVAVLMCVFKAAGLHQLSWLWTTCPLWAPTAACLALALLVTGIGAVLQLTGLRR